MRNLKKEKRKRKFYLVKLFYYTRHVRDYS